ncbi:MAG: glycosyltransferase family 9 protein [Candidatus Omnitrophica bacterium]|nr:glycosyltransferase family 9 protein [Candidatus Omnitrophota bacterium]
MDAPPQALDPRAVVWIRLDRFGEVLLNLPAVGVLRRAYPAARITLLVQPYLSELVAGSPDVNEVLSYAPSSGDAWWREAWRVARLLRPHRFDVAVVAHPKKSLHLAAALAGIPRRLGYDRKWGWLLTHRLADDKVARRRHEVDANVHLLERLGIVAEPVPLSLPVAAKTAIRVAALLRQEGIHDGDCIVGLHPWTSHPRKQWPVERFRQCLERLATTTPAVPVILGGVEEAEAARRLCAGLGSRPVSLAGRVNLLELAALLQRCRVLLTNDSGPMHLAAAVGTPVVALFGGSDPAASPERWAPRGDGHTVLRAEELSAISVEQVVQAVQRYLAS